MGHRAFVLISFLALGLASPHASGDQPAPDVGHLREVISETAEECKQIEGKVARGSALSELSSALACTGDLDGALDLAKTDPTQCVTALRHVACRLAAAGRFEDAEHVAELVEGPIWQCRVLVDFAAAYTDAGHSDKAVFCLERAEPLAREAKDPEILARVGLFYAGAGRRDLAKQTFTAAVELKREEKRGGTGDPMQDTIYEVQARAGFVDEAIQNGIAGNRHSVIRDIAIWQAFSGDIDSAKATAQKDSVAWSVKALEAIACFEIMAGNREDALATLQTVLDLASAQPRRTSLPKVQKTVAVILAQFGETAKALELTEQIKDERPGDGTSIEARIEVAVRIAGSDHDDAVRLLSEALEGARALAEPNVQTWVLSTIGLAYHEVGMDGTARELCLEAVGRSEVEPATGALRPHFIAVLAQAGATDEARKLFEDALERTGDKGSSPAAVALSLADAGLFDEAKDVALKLADPIVLRQIVRAQTKQQDAHRALAWIERIERPALRASALHALAVAVATPEDLPDARFNVRPAIAARLDPFGLEPY